MNHRLWLSVFPMLGVAFTPNRAAAQRTAGLDSVVLERTPCFGTCPAYRLSIVRGGLVSFRSRDRGDTAYWARDAVAASALDTIERRAERFGFFDLPEDITKDPVLCKDRATDHPTIIVGLFGQRSKRVIYYTGCYAQCCEHSRAQRLQNFDRLATSIDSITDSSRWLKSARRAPPTDFSAFRDARLARRRDAILAAPRCPAVTLLDTVGWMDALPGDTTMSLRLPKEFIRDTAFLAFHGGERWTAGDRAISVETGFWTPAPQNNGAGPCRLTVSAGDYIVDESRNAGGYDWSAMPADTVWRMTKQIGGYSPRHEDRALFLTVLSTLLRR
jgi:hypothetical protein